LLAEPSSQKLWNRPKMEEKFWAPIFNHSAKQWFRTCGKASQVRVSLDCPPLASTRVASYLRFRRCAKTSASTVDCPFPFSLLRTRTCICGCPSASANVPEVESFSSFPKFQNYSEPRPVNTQGHEGPARTYQKVWNHRTDLLELSERVKQHQN